MITNKMINEYTCTCNCKKVNDKAQEMFNNEIKSNMILKESL